MRLNKNFKLSNVIIRLTKVKLRCLRTIYLQTKDETQVKLYGMYGM